ncbi:uncharacterized protein [Littorina saxatilis]|uniref:C1q domain-containing protein n=1 Tax=Littorina saxatilis TaxID=31220 RepID=A0AAN9G6B5_9CAEN
MKTSPTLPLPTLLLLLFILGQFPVAGKRAQTQIWESGVYIITLVSDPEHDGQTIVRLLLNFKDTIFIAYVDDNVIGGLSVALPLKRGDYVGERPEGPRSKHSAISYSVAFVGSSTKYFTTVRSDGWLHSDKTVGFLSYITESGSWTNYPYRRIMYSVPRDGVYWIMARPDGSTGHWTTVNIMGLFNAYSGLGVPISASGAFYLTTKDKISMKVTTGQSHIDPATMMSWVYLENNTPEKLKGTYMAFTDTVPPMYAKDYGTDENVAFGGSRLLDRGNMYDQSSKVFSISISGTYILSLRGNPAIHKSLRLQVYCNNKLVFQSFAQRGVSSGQASVFTFERGDRLYIRARDYRHVGKHTMISIALLSKKDRQRLYQ